MNIRRIAHIDMDAFYASVELLRYPQLKGLPVVIGGGRANVREALALLRAQEGEREWDAASERELLARIPIASFARLESYTGRGVITTATYAARQFGIGSAMGMMKAARLCPQAIMLPVDFEEYRRYSRQFKTIITDITPVMQDRGVDEVYVDFTDVPGGQREGGRTLAKLIQKSIFNATGLTCSVGVAPNKLLAKMASEFHKPNGISIVYEEDIQNKIWPLTVRKINGIGPKAEEKLQAHGIFTIGDIAAQDKFDLMQRHGKSYGAWLHDAAWGRDDAPVSTESEPVSMSRETTFERDQHALHDKAALSLVFTELCESVAHDLQRKGYKGKTIGIKLRWGNFKIATRDMTIEIATDNAKTIRHTAGQCLKRLDLSQRFRLLGVRVGKLEKAISMENMPFNPVEYAQVAINNIATLKSTATNQEDYPELF